VKRSIGDFIDYQLTCFLKNRQDTISLPFFAFCYCATHPGPPPLSFAAKSSAAAQQRCGANQCATYRTVFFQLN